MGGSWYFFGGRSCGGQASGKRWQIASTWPTSNIPGQISGLPKIRTSFPYKNTVPKLGTSYLQREVWEVTEMRKLSYRKFGKMLSSSSSSQCGRTASVETYWNILKLPKQFYSEEMMCLLAGSPGSLDWQKDHSLNQYESIQLAHSSSTSPQKKPWISINIHQSWMLMFHLCPLQSPHVAWAISGTRDRWDWDPSTRTKSTAGPSKSSAPGSTDPGHTDPENGPWHRRLAPKKHNDSIHFLVLRNWSSWSRKCRQIWTNI